MAVDSTWVCAKAVTLKFAYLGEIFISNFLVYFEQTRYYGMPYFYSSFTLLQSFPSRMLCSVETCQLNFVAPGFLEQHSFTD